MRVFQIVPEPGQEVCDFCASAPQWKVYSCRNFVIPWRKHAAFAHESIGGWAACQKCAETIDGDRWSDLTDRALRKFIQRHGVSRHDQPHVREQLRQVYQLFREHMSKES